MSNKSPCNGPAHSLDGSEVKETIFKTKMEKFDDLLEACSIIDCKTESFDLSTWLFSNYDNDHKTSSNITTNCNNSVENTIENFDEPLRWKCQTFDVNYDPRPITKRSRKRSIPEEMKDDTYWKKRFQNTERARRCREARRVKEIEVAQKVKKLEKEKLELQQEINQLKEQLMSLNERLVRCEQPKHWHY